VVSSPILFKLQPQEQVFSDSGKSWICCTRGKSSVIGFLPGFLRWYAATVISLSASTISSVLSGCVTSSNKEGWLGLSLPGIK
jgi:hypothetical protein